ncbi:MAG TPA: RraA family protein [Bryobacteraceae bacterium]|nr:RraA family protein [Bryobacteraceae bacterium]
MTDQYAVRGVDLNKLRAFDTCTVSNAIERLDVRLRNEGFVAHEVRCQFPDLSPMVGYAATARIRTSSPPMTQRCYYDRPDWWNYVASVPEPRVMVLQDVDHNLGLGAFVGEIHAVIGQVLRCVGCVTNGSVRDLPEVEAIGFHLFAGSVSVSHAYAHIIEFGEPVEIGGLKIESGDLLHGDRHGVLKIPFSIASQVPEEAYKVRCEEKELIEYCKSPGFSLDELTERIRSASANCDLPWRPR